MLCAPSNNKKSFLAPIRYKFKSVLSANYVMKQEKFGKYIIFIIAIELTVFK